MDFDSCLSNSNYLRAIPVPDKTAIVPQLNKCLKFIAFWGVTLYRIQSFLSPRKDMNFRHLSSCDTIPLLQRQYLIMFFSYLVLLPFWKVIVVERF